MTDKPTPLWIREFDDYTLFCDGAYLMRVYTDLSVIKDARKVTYWTLVDLLQGWMQALDLSFVYGNTWQIKDFVPTALHHINAIVGELQRRKRPANKRLTRVVRTPDGQHLDARAIKFQVDAMKVFEHYFHDIKKNGKYYKAKCPFHDDHRPSFVIYPEGGAYCFVCNRQADIYDIVMHFEQCTFVDAVALVWRNWC